MPLEMLNARQTKIHTLCGNECGYGPFRIPSRLEKEAMPGRKRRTIKCAAAVIVGVLVVVLKIPRDVAVLRILRHCARGIVILIRPGKGDGIAERRRDDGEIHGGQRRGIIHGKRGIDRKRRDRPARAPVQGIACRVCVGRDIAALHFLDRVDRVLRRDEHVFVGDPRVHRFRAHRLVTTRVRLHDDACILVQRIDEVFRVAVKARRIAVYHLRNSLLYVRPYVNVALFRLSPKVESHLVIVRSRVVLRDVQPRLAVDDLSALLQTLPQRAFGKRELRRGDLVELPRLRCIQPEPRRLALADGLRQVQYPVDHVFHRPLL